MEFTLIHRSKIIISAYADWIPPQSKVLDVGCGNGVVTEELRRRFSCSIVGTDVVDYRKRNIPFRIMDDQQTLPFEDDSFDLAMFNDVLHHCADPERLLREAIRVSGTSLIFEIEASALSRSADLLINQIHNRAMSRAINMRTSDQWRDYFKGLKLDFEYREVPRPFFLYPFTNFAFRFVKGDDG